MTCCRLWWRELSLLHLIDSKQADCVRESLCTRDKREYLGTGSFPYLFESAHPLPLISFYHIASIKNAYHYAILRSNQASFEFHRFTMSILDAPPTLDTSPAELRLKIYKECIKGLHYSAVIEIRNAKAKCRGIRQDAFYVKVTNTRESGAPRVPVWGRELLSINRLIRVELSHTLDLNSDVSLERFSRTNRPFTPLADRVPEPWKHLITTIRENLSSAIPLHVLPTLQPHLLPSLRKIITIDTSHFDADYRHHIIRRPLPPLCAPDTAHHTSHIKTLIEGKLESWRSRDTTVHQHRPDLEWETSCE